MPVISSRICGDVFSVSRLGLRAFLFGVLVVGTFWLLLFLCGFLYGIWVHSFSATIMASSSSLLLSGCVSLLIFCIVVAIFSLNKGASDRTREGEVRANKGKDRCSAGNVTRGEDIEESYERVVNFLETKK